MKETINSTARGTTPRRSQRSGSASEAPSTTSESRHEAPQEGSPRPFQTVYTIVERERDGQKFWLKIGAAFANRDGSLHVKLDAMPTNGQLHIRESKSPEERQQDGQHAVAEQ